MNHLIVPSTSPVPHDSRDKGSKFTILWLTWIAAFFAIEFTAIHEDAKHHDKVKRTLTSNLRWWAATDSVMGIATDAKYGKLRRLALICGLAWFTAHIERNGVV